MILRKPFYLPFLILIALLCGACETDILGYPKDVYFSSQGGPQYVYGKDLEGAIVSIHDNNGNENSIKVETRIYNEATGEWVHNPSGTKFVSLLWLDITVEPDENRMLLYAQPLDVNNKRILYVDLYSGSKKGTLKVTQR